MLFVGSNPTPSTTNETVTPDACARGDLCYDDFMALRRYNVIRADGSEGELLEVEQPAGAPDLALHPLTGEKLQRILDAPGLTGKWTERAMGNAAKDSKRMKAGGFRKLERDGNTWHDVT
jgi:hypothetical protein